MKRPNRVVLPHCLLLIFLVLFLQNATKANTNLSTNKRKEVFTNLRAAAPVISSFSPASGAVGTLVTINGTSLDNTTAFSIGGVSAIVISNNGNQLVGMVMPGAVTGTIGVSTADGSVISTGNFTVTATTFPNPQENKKIATGSAPSQLFGSDVAVSADGNTAVIGQSTYNSQKGIAWIYIRRNGNWALQAQLTGADAVGTARQGQSVAINADGNTVAFGGYGDNGNMGAAWVFVKNGNAWQQQGPKLVGSGYVGAPWQGNTIALSADGSTLVSAGFDDDGSKGATWLFTRSSNGVWSQQGSKLVGQAFAVDLSADGKTLITGMPNNNNSAGEAFVYRLSGGNWVLNQKLSANVTGNFPYFGMSVSLNADGTTALIGSPYDISNGTYAIGSAWVFTRSGTTWTQQRSKLVGNDYFLSGSMNTEMGMSVKLSADGNTAVFGGNNDNNVKGAVWVFKRSGTTWTQAGSKLVPPDAIGNAAFGNRIALNANATTMLAIGAGDNSVRGAVWEFVSVPSPTIQTSNITFSNISLTTAALNWINGNGASRAVFIKQANTGSALPIDANTYTANTAFGQGTQIGSSGWYCVYKGTGSSVNLTGLTAGTQYQVMATEYNGNSGYEKYLTTAATNNPATLTTTSPPTITNISPSSGPVGTLVTVTGTNLDNPTSITIGGKNAVVISSSATTAVAMVMPGSVNGNISFNNSNGTATSLSNFTITSTLAPGQQQGSKLVASGNTGPPQLGRSVAISADGNTAVIGGDADNSSAGAVWIYSRVNGVWAQNGAKLTGLNATATARMGTSVAISADGNTIAFGGPNDNGGIGAAWIFVKNGNNWQQQGAKLVGNGYTGSNVQQGEALALSADGNTLVITSSNDNNQQGAAWVFTRNNGVWAQQGNKMVGTGNIGAAYQGTSAAISADGNTIAIGAIGDNLGKGAAWIYKRNNGIWTQEQKIAGTGNNGAANQGKSIAISADGNTLILGGYNDWNASLEPAGAVWVFSRTNNIWSQQGNKLVGSGYGELGSRQGISVALSADGNTAMWGGSYDNYSRGALWIFNRSNNIWSQTGSKLTGNDLVNGGTYLGRSLALSADGSTAIAGGNQDNLLNGAAWVFVPVTQPTVQATNIVFTNVTPNAATLNWTNGDGASRAVFVKQANTGSTSPVDVNSYTANAAFLLGTQIGSTGWYCVYNGAGSTVNLTGLTAGAQYRVMVTEYNGTAGAERYLTTTATDNPATLTTLSTDATLSALSASAGTLAPVFASATTSYTVNVDNEVSSITVTPISTNSNATIKVNGSSVTSATASNAIALNVGNNTINTVVTAQDGVATKTYTLTVIRALSSDATLSSLVLNTGTLTPVFNPATITYSANVANTVNSITITPTTSETNATVKVNGATLNSGSTSNAIALNVGSNIVTVVVTAQDGATTKTYTVNVTRAASTDATLAGLSLSSGSLSPAFASATTNYTALVTNGVNSITVTPTLADANATVKVNGTTVNNGSASNAIVLNVGSNNITVVVTAQDGSTIKTYTINVTRSASTDATLAGLLLSSGTLSPSFAPATISYTASVANGINSITVSPTPADANATVKVNGTTVNNGSASNAIVLNVGSNTITVVVTAQDGTTTKTYTVNVTRAASTDATLAGLSLSSGNLSPAFASATASYTASVANGVNSITVTPILANANATVKVNGITVNNGSASNAIVLNVGSNTITVVVTAQDGTTTKTYTVNVTCAASTDATLAGLSLSSGNLSPAFASATASYTASVANGVNSITVTPILANANATVKVNGITVNNGSASNAIVLNLGSNTVTIIVTAQDGTTTKTYTVNVTRAVSTDATLAGLSLSSGSLSPAFASATASYTASVANGVNSITVTPTLADANATVKVNGTTVNNGSASNAIMLNVGSNTIAVVATAQDGSTTKTYIVKVTRAASIDATLASLAMSQGNLSPVFDPATLNYSSTVANAVNSISITATLNDANATLKINGTNQNSGGISNPILLNTGLNVINVSVTAQDGAAVRNYMINVTRLASSNALLSNITIDNVILKPAFVSAQTTYTAQVNYETTNITVDALASDQSTGVSIFSGAAVKYRNIKTLNLEIGKNIIPVIATAEDGITRKTYTLIIERIDRLLSIPTAFSPNGDGINDFWNIGFISNYPNSIVEIYDRNGTRVHYSVGYAIPWDGTFRGASQAAGTYYYAIDLKNGQKAVTGYITLLK